MAEFERSHGHDQHLVLLDLIFLHDNPLIRSAFSWNDVAGLREDSPGTTDWPALIEMVRRHEGEPSALIAARWFSRQPQGVQVFRNGSGAVTGFNCFVTLRPDEREWSMFDPCAAGIWHFLGTRPPLLPGQVVAVDRFWMDADSYQGLSPTQGMVFVNATRYVLTTPDLAYTFYVWKNADQWRMAAEQVLFERVEEVDFVVGEEYFSVFMRDWVATPTAAWLDALAARETD
ncbi:hypothetical protein SE17_20805 [Kouleothrix aurantiaca]|uniref:Uncharacterized protein n=1 Tax=Kouleothrix aurantiaca TaxID=186479 RepID=A0A0P9D0K5_9CHLR|nr:hypothetical protein SE17_20805 [Kouleothrix aurantiaca]